MNSRLHAAAYALLVIRDGEKCSECGRIPVGEIKDLLKEVPKLVIHHVDGNNDNNPADGSNWKLLCQRCNVLRDPRGPQAYPKFSSHLRLKMSHENERETEKHTLRVRYLEMAKSLEAEPIFREFVCRTIKALGAVKKWDLLDAGAEDFHKQTENTISQQALAKYLDKLCNPINGAFEYFRQEEDWFVRRRNGKP
jgi:hypothetical protein